MRALLNMAISSKDDLREKHGGIPAGRASGRRSRRAAGRYPDDPPRPILGPPRIVPDYRRYAVAKETVDSITTAFYHVYGSYGVRADNDLVRMIETFGDRIHFTCVQPAVKRIKTFQWQPILAAT